MTNAEYEQTQHSIVTLSGLIADMDLAGFINRINRAETMGVFLVAPREYQKATPVMANLKRLAHALMDVQAAACEIRGAGPGETLLPEYSEIELPDWKQER